jgi:hypothetical protein
MGKLNDILRLKHQAGLSHAKIATALGLSKGVVGKYVSLANAKGIACPLPEGMDEAALKRLLFPLPGRAGPFADPDLLEIHQELKRKGVTLHFLWGEYAPLPMGNVHCATASSVPAAATGGPPSAAPRASISARARSASSTTVARAFRSLIRPPARSAAHRSLSEAAGSDLATSQPWKGNGAGSCPDSTPKCNTGSQW